MRRTAWWARVLLGTFVLQAVAVPNRWTPPERLVLGTEPEAIGAYTISAAKSLVWIIWSERRFGPGELFWRVGSVDGTPWSEEQLIPGTAVGPGAVHSVPDGEGLSLVWIRVRNPAGTGDLIYQHYSDGVWRSPLVLDDSGTAARPRIAWAPGPPALLGVVYERHEAADRTSVWYVESRNGGLDWSAPERLSPRDVTAGEPTIIGGAEQFWIAWRDEREGIGRIVLTRRGAPAPMVDRVLSVGGPARRPVLARAGATLWAGWEELDPFGLADVVLTQGSLHADRWQVPEPIGRTPAQSVRLALAAGEDRVLALWQEGGDGWHLAWTEREASQPALPPDVFHRTDQEALRPQLAVDYPPQTAPQLASAWIHALWMEVDDTGRPSLWYSLRDPLPPPVPKQPRFVDVTAPRNWDDDGRLLFRWPAVPGAVGYVVFVSIDGAPFQEQQSVALPEATVVAEEGQTIRIRVAAQDRAGNRSEPSPPTPPIRVDRTPPQVQIHTPTDGARVVFPALIRITCQDTNLRSFQVELGATPQPQQWELLAGPFKEPLVQTVVGTLDPRGRDGVFTLRLVAEDFAGHRSEERTVLRIDRTPPLPVQIAATQPLNAAATEIGARQDPRWSPRGEEIAFVTDEGGTRDVWRYDLIENRAVPITQDVFLDAQPSWSPDGEWLVYASRREDNWDLYAVRRDGSEIRPLLQSPANERDPDWSPDGQRIAFASDQNGDYEIYVLEGVPAVLAGATPQVRQWTHNNDDDRHPAWAPDARSLVFARRQAGRWNLWLLTDPGAEVQPLLRSPYDDQSPRFGPEGKRILFVRRTQPDRPELVLFDRVRGVETPLESGVTEAADWSPDGRTLVLAQQGRVLLAPLRFPEPRLEARIVEPANGAFLAGSVAVLGVARGSAFDHYVLEYRPDRPNAAWQPITGTVSAPVGESGVLGLWNLSGVSGPVRLRLIVFDRDGGQIVDEKRVIVPFELPELRVDSPPDGLETTADSVPVRGRATPGATVLLNDEPLPVSPEGSFALDFPLEPGENRLLFQTRTAQGSETSTLRRVFRVVEPFVVEWTRPGPYEAIPTPYTLVEGRAAEAISLTVQGVPLPLGADGTFRHPIAVGTEGRTIRLEAHDRLGRAQALERTVFFVPESAGDGTDTISPALVEPNPPFGATLTQSQPTFTARLVDDRGVDEESLQIALDGTPLNPDAWKFDPQTGTLRLQPEAALPDGDHRWTLAAQDLFGNALLFGEWPFRIDTRPWLVALTALPESIEPDGRVRTRILLESSRPLRTVGAVQALFGHSTIGIPLRLEPTQTDSIARLAQTLTLPTPEPLLLEALVQDPSGQSRRAEGLLALLELGATTPRTQLLPDGIRIEVAPASRRARNWLVVRTADLADPTTALFQAQDALVRRLEPSSALYQVESFKAGEALPSFRLAAPEDPGTPRAWFRWNPAGQRWEAPPEQYVQEGLRWIESSTADTFALFQDTDPPTLVRVQPDPEAGPLEHFQVEALFTDQGAGVAPGGWVQIDGRPVPTEVRLDGNNGLYRAFLSDLDTGLHRVEFLVPDRAGNLLTAALDYFARRRFDIIGVRLVPNPGRGERGIVQFQLTERATVTLEIYTASGQLVYRAALEGVLGDLSDPTTREKFVWRYENAAGEPLAPGVYLVQFRAVNRRGEERRRLLKWALIR